MTLIKGVSLSLRFHFDLLCPHSYLGYQIIQQKLPSWTAKAAPGAFTVDYLPILGPKLFRWSHGVLYDGVHKTKRDYIVRELATIADCYGIKRPDQFQWNCDLLDKRSVASLLFLAYLRREKPHLFHPFLKTFWEAIWFKNMPITKMARIMRIGRELGIPFRQMDDMVAHIESPMNVQDVLFLTTNLAVSDATGSPWIKFGTEEYCWSFKEILKLELIDHFIEHPEQLPKEKKIPEGKRPNYPSPRSTFFEDYST